MIQRLYEFMLDLSVDNIRFYNFLVKTFPKLDKNYTERMEKRIEKVYIPQAKMDEITHNVWQRLCEDIPTLDKNKY